MTDMGGHASPPEELDSPRAMSESQHPHGATSPPPARQPSAMRRVVHKLRKLIKGRLRGSGGGGNST